MFGIYCMYMYIQDENKLKDIKVVIRSRKSKKDRQNNDKKKKRGNDKQWSTKHYTDNKTKQETNSWENFFWKKIRFYKKI